MSDDRQIRWQISDDKNTARVSINAGETCMADIILTPAALEATIAGLTKIRAMMTPAVPTEFPIGQKLDAVPDPRWYTEIEAMTQFTMLCLRHPGLGWQAFLLPPAETDKVIELWQKQRDARASAPTPGPVN